MRSIPPSNRCFAHPHPRNRALHRRVVLQEASLTGSICSECLLTRFSCESQGRRWRWRRKRNRTSIKSAQFFGFFLHVCSPVMLLIFITCSLMNNTFDIHFCALGNTRSHMPTTHAHHTCQHTSAPFTYPRYRQPLTHNMCKCMSDVVYSCETHTTFTRLRRHPSARHLSQYIIPNHIIWSIGIYMIIFFKYIFSSDPQTHARQPYGKCLNHFYSQQWKRGGSEEASIEYRTNGNITASQPWMPSNGIRNLSE